MLEIKRKTVILEMDRNDLWKIVTALKEGVVNETKLKWVKHFQGDSEREFIHYVRSNHYLIFKYLEEIYIYLERPDIFEALESDLIKILQNVRGQINEPLKD
jgi:hypothetical protein